MCIMSQAGRAARVSINFKVSERVGGINWLFRRAHHGAKSCLTIRVIPREARAFAQLCGTAKQVASMCSSL